MKRLIPLLAALLLTVDALAIGPWSPSKRIVEGYGHLSFSEATNSSAGAAYIWGRQQTKGFFLGAGTGLRYVHSVKEFEDLGDGSRIVHYGDEGVMPLFVRARFGRVRPMKFKPFVTLDIGTVINLKKDGNTKGFFFEPQLGIDLTENAYISIGVDSHHFLSRSILRMSDVIGTVRDPEQKVKDVMATGLSLHVGYSF